MGETCCEKNLLGWTLEPCNGDEITRPKSSSKNPSMFRSLSSSHKKKVENLVELRKKVVESFLAKKTSQKRFKTGHVPYGTSDYVRFLSIPLFRS